MAKNKRKSEDLRIKNKKLATIIGIVAGSVYLFFFVYQHFI